MTNETNLETLAEEQKLIEREFPYPNVSEISHKTCIEKILHNCAYAATDSTIENSKNEARRNYSKAIKKSIWTIGTSVGATYLINRFGEMHAGHQFLSALGIIVAAYSLKLNLIGKHVFSNFGAYIKTPYFSIFDDLKIGHNWRKIAKFQLASKMSQGKNIVYTADCYRELGRNFIGGP